MVLQGWQKPQQFKICCCGFWVFGLYCGFWCFTEVFVVFVVFHNILKRIEF